MNIKRCLLVIVLIFLTINASLIISSISISGNPFFTVNPYSILISTYILTLLPLFIGILIMYYIISNRREVVNYFKKILRLLSKSGDIEYDKKNIKSFLGVISAFIILFALYLLIRKRYVENKELDVEKNTATTNQISFIQIFDVNVNFIDVENAKDLTYILNITFLLYSIMLISVIILFIYAFYTYKSELEFENKLVFKRVKESFEEAIYRIKTGDRIRDVIIDIYKKLIKIMVDLGYTPLPQETPREYELRLLSKLPIPKDAIRKLTMLFEEARYSQHELSDDAIKEAIVAISCIGRSLGIEVKI